MISQQKAERIRDILMDVAEMIRQTPSDKFEKVAAQYERDAAWLDWIISENADDNSCRSIKNEEKKN